MPYKEAVTFFTFFYVVSDEVVMTNPSLYVCSFDKTYKVLR